MRRKQKLASAASWHPKRKLGVTMHFSEIITLSFEKNNKKKRHRLLCILLLVRILAAPHSLVINDSRWDPLLQSYQALITVINLRAQNLSTLSTYCNMGFSPSSKE